MTRLSRVPTPPSWTTASSPAGRSCSPGAGPFGGDEEIAEPLVTGGKKYADVDQDICAHTEQFPTRRWWIAFAIALSFLGLLVFSLISLFYVGMGIVGINSPVGWGPFIVNFVFWIGIGHAGTLISAVLFLFRQKWRTGINRAAEAMTLFAVACAGIFPLIHLGRLWFAYWLVPYPNGRGPLWINFNSPLAWDIFAISTYGLVSLTFWYVGLLPDLATVRDRATHPWRKKLYNAMSFGWTGSNRAWRHYESAYLILAGLRHAAGVLGAHHRLLRLRHRRSCRAGTPRSSRPTSSSAPSSRASPWSSP